ncbi:MAG: YdaU family protein [Acidobacteriaceae bacterium]
MAALPYIQLYVADYLADTAHLTAAQHGAYLLLIFNYWQRGHALNNSNERLANVARMTNDEWTASKHVLAEFFSIDGDEWFHSRIESDLEAVRLKSAKASNAGKASVEKRLNKRSADVEQTLNHTDTDTDTDTEKRKYSENPSRILRPPCPHQEIIALYHEILPTNPRIRDWTPTRAKHLKARWDENPDRQNLEYWKGLFEYISRIPFLTGKVSNGSRKPFMLSIDWLVKPENFAKVREGRYAD